MGRLLRWYGASPLHLLAMLACFGLAGYAAVRLVSFNALGVVVWFLGAVVGHDLLLMPLYSLADRSVMAAIRHREPPLPATGWINYVRVPRPRPGADAAVLPGGRSGHGGDQARGAAAARDRVDQLRAGARRAVRPAAPGVVPADPPAALALPCVDDAVRGPVRVALAGGDGRAVPAVRGGVRIPAPARSTKPRTARTATSPGTRRG